MWDRTRAEGGKRCSFLRLWLSSGGYGQPCVEGRELEPFGIAIARSDRRHNLKGHRGAQRLISDAVRGTSISPRGVEYAGHQLE
jgi:hypothetical protein